MNPVVLRRIETPHPPSGLRIAAERLGPTQPGNTIVETHVSSLVFTGELVHKRKKDVRFAFVDQSTPELREQLCRREVELNRRFSPDVYLGVEDIVDDAGRTVDHAVLMHRMPDDRRLATLVSAHDDVSSCLAAVARQVATYHAQAPRGANISAVGTPAFLHDLWRRSLTEIATFAPRVLDANLLASIGRLAHHYVDGRGALLAARIDAGRIVDGHGDLLADDIFCTDDGPRILDCLEFDDRLRWGDVLLDIGFLAMDLEHLGRPDLAQELLDQYMTYSDDAYPLSLEHHYVAYRALVRAKVSCLKGAAGDEAQARRYLAQCHRHLRDGRVQLVVVGGLPGTGKTTVAATLAERLGWAVVHSDVTRKTLVGLDPDEHHPDAYEQGLYSPQRTAATYEAMFTDARRRMGLGESVIIDASFADQHWRTEAAKLADEMSADLTELRCLLPTAEALHRLERRAATSADASDADAVIALRMSLDFDDWPGAVPVGTLPPIDDVVAPVLERLYEPR